MYALMAIPNFIAPLLLSPVLFRIACEYWDEMDTAEKARREEKRKRRHNACRLIHLHTFFPDIYSAPASQTGRYPYRYAAGRFHRMPCRKKTGRKTAFILKRTTIPCRTPLPLPGTGKNFRHDTHPEKPSEIHERTKISAKRPDNRGHTICRQDRPTPPMPSRHEPDTVRNHVYFPFCRRAAGNGDIMAFLLAKTAAVPRVSASRSPKRFPDNRIFPPARAVDSGRPDHGSGGREERAKSMTMTIPASAQNAPAPNTDE